MQQVNMDKAQYQLGKTKIFVKAPESVCFILQLLTFSLRSISFVILKLSDTIFAFDLKI
jgi:myosin heavy subunit